VPYSSYVFTVNADATFGQFIRDEDTGLLSEIGSQPPAIVGTPTDLTVDPSGNNIFLTSVDNGVGQVTGYTIDEAIGFLSLANTLIFSSNPRTVEVHPAGRFVYVADFGGNQVRPYVMRSATLSATNVSAGAPDARGIAFSPDGRFAYLGLDVGAVNFIGVYRAAASDGDLTSVPGPPAVGNDPVAVAVSPDGALAYVAVREPGGVGSINPFTIDQASGVLTPLTGVTIGLNPTDLAFDATGDRLYVINADGDDLTVFDVNRSTGELTQRSVVLVGDEPVSIAVQQRVE